MDKANHRGRKYYSQKPTQFGNVTHLELSFGNLCNQSCAMCGSAYSTGWFKHDQVAIQQGLDFRKSSWTVDLESSVYSKLSDESFSKITQLIPGLKSATIKGGEPLTHPQCIEFLKLVADQNPKVDISMTTNFSMDTSEIFNLLPRLPNFNLDISFDGVGDLYNWIRGDEFQKTFANVKKLSAEFPGRFHFIIATSVFNILRLKELIGFLLDFKPPIIYINSVNSPRYCSPLMLKKGVLETQLIDLRNFFDQLDSPTRIEGFDLEGFLRQTNESKWTTQTKQWIDYINQMRKLDLYEIVPELKDSLDFD